MIMKVSLKVGASGKTREVNNMNRVEMLGASAMVRSCHAGLSPYSSLSRVARARVGVGSTSLRGGARSRSWLVELFLECLG